MASKKTQNLAAFIELLTAAGVGLEQPPKSQTPQKPARDYPGVKMDGIVLGNEAIERLQRIAQEVGPAISAVKHIRGVEQPDGTLAIFGWLPDQQGQYRCRMLSAIDPGEWMYAGALPAALSARKEVL